MDSVRLRLGLDRAIAHWATYYPTHPALIVGGEEFTYGSIDSQASQIAQHLHQRGVEPRGRVGLLLESRPAFIAALVATLRCGATAVVLQPGWSSAQRQLACVESGVSMVLDDCETEVLQGTHFRVAGASPIQHSRWVDSEWAVLFSSGTTGAPKGIVRTDLSILNELISWCLELGISKRSTFYIGRPIYYTGGLVLTGACLLARARLVFPEQHSPEALADAVARHGVTTAFLIPEQLRHLVAYVRRGGKGRWPDSILTMGAMVGSRLKREAADLLGANLIESWGNTEGLGTICEEGDAHVRPASIGRPFVGDRMTVVQPDGIECGLGQHGLLAGEADSVLSRYEAADRAGRCAFSGDLVVSEDVGYRDDQGYFYIVGRQSDMVDIEGLTVNLAAVEAAASLALHGAYAVAAAVIPLLEGRPALVLGVEAESHAQAYVEESLERFMRPAPDDERGWSLRSVACLGQLPRNAGGKVVRSALGALLVDRGVSGASGPIGQ